MRELGILAILAPHFVAWVATPELRSLLTSVIIALVVYFTGGRPPGASKAPRELSRN